MALRRAKIALPLIVLIGLILVVMLEGRRPAVVTTDLKGQSAPDFLLKDLKGRDVRLSDFSGQLVLLNFWATWCPPCRKEMPSMQSLYTAMQGRPFKILAVSVDDDPKRVTRFLSAMKYTFPVLLDLEEKAALLYQTTGVPETFLIGPDGTILYKVIGPVDWANPENLAVIEQHLPKTRTEEN